MGVFGDVRMQIVHQHAHRGLCQPAFGGQFGPGCGKNIAGILAGIAHDRPLGVGTSLARVKEGWVLFLCRSSAGTHMFRKQGSGCVC